MRHHHHRQCLRLAAGMATFLLLLAACRGGSSGTAPSIPASSAASRPLVDRGTAPNGEVRGELFSSCGHHVHIVLAGIVNCRFHEVGDRGDVFTLKNHTRGLILISPMTGTRRTTFTITGLVVGSGHFTVRDGRKNRLIVTVRITL
jgi:hypothetical protein